MARTITFKRVKVTKHPWESHLRRYERDVRKLPEREAVFTRRRARSIMKKAPKKPKSRYGNYRMYKPDTYKRRLDKFRAGKGRRPTRGYWRKGLHSRPGHPPYWQPENKDFNLRTIDFGPVKPLIKHQRPQGGSKNVYAWRVGPRYSPTKLRTPVPQLHEYGGTITLKYDRGKKHYQTRGLKQIQLKAKAGQTLKYPPRPYMRPSAKEARESAARKSPYTLKAITKLGGMKGKRIY